MSWPVWHCRLAFALLIAALAARTAAAGAVKDVKDSAACARAAAKSEDGRLIPVALLHAIALAESGRWLAADGADVAWPWTVTAEGQGRFFPSRAAAIDHVRALRARGVRNIDVGCMQINLMYHPDAFDSLEQAFDPERNTAYAADFLRQLRIDTRSLTGAVARYHSADPQRGRGYWRKVESLWVVTRRQAFEARRRAVRAAARARHAARLAQRLTGP